MILGKSLAEVYSTTTLAQARLILRCHARIQAVETRQNMQAALAANAAIHGSKGADMFNELAAVLNAAARSEPPPEPESLATRVSRQLQS